MEYILVANTVKLKRSSVQGKVPLVSDLQLGELAVNTYDGKLYLKKNVGGTESIVDVSSGLSAAEILTLLKTVDGAGSGLDADLLDGLSSSSTNTVSTIVARDASGLVATTGVSFDTTQNDVGAVGRLKWNDGDGTLDLGLKGGNVTLQLGQEQVVLGYNATASTLIEGQVVRVSGAQGGRAALSLAQANQENTSATTFGIVTESIAAGAEGFITTFGLVRGLNTSSYSEGAVLWLDPNTPGAFTTTKPIAPNHLVQVGIVIRSHASTGLVFVSIANGYELSELHDVNISSPNTGHLLVYDAVTSTWKNADTISVNKSTAALNITQNGTGTAITASGVIESSSGGYKYPDGTVQLTSAVPIVNNITATTYSPTANKGHNVVFANTTSNNITVTLPTAVANAAMYTIKKVHTNNTLTIACTGAETIDGSTTVSIVVENESLTLISDGTIWRVI